MSDTKEQEEIKTFIPEITLEITRSALIHVTITNIDDYWKHNSFDLPIRKCLRLFYRFDRNNQIISKTKSIACGRITRDGQFYLKPELFLSGYKLALSISAINRKTQQFMTKSEMYTTNVPSIWSLNEYKIGDKVVFKAEKQAITREARIVEVLSDNKYKLTYEDKTHKEIETECEASRLFIEAPNIRFTISLTNNSHCIRHLLLKRNDEQSMNIYNAIKEGLRDNSAVLFAAISMYQFDFLIHLTPITDFISYNIIGYLCEPSFNNSIHCLFDVKHKDTLKFVNEMTYLYDVAFELGGMDVDTMESLNCSCDLCRTEISEWSYLFVDETCIDEAHHYCMNCILTTILRNKELKSVLHEALEDELNVNCIDEIVNCLIGSVIYTDLEYRKTNDGGSMDVELESNYNKRLINDAVELMPNAKRRKLNF